MSFNLQAEIKPLQSWFFDAFPAKRTGTHRVYDIETKTKILSFVKKSKAHHVPMRQVELALGLADGTLKQWLREPSQDLTSKAKLAVEVARKVLGSYALDSDVEQRATALMGLSERRLQGMLDTPSPKQEPNGTKLTLSTRDGFTIEGLTISQVMELIKTQ